MLLPFNSVFGIIRVNCQDCIVNCNLLFSESTQPGPPSSYSLSALERISGKLPISERCRIQRTPDSGLLDEVHVNTEAAVMSDMKSFINKHGGIRMWDSSPHCSALSYNSVCYLEPDI